MKRLFNLIFSALALAGITFGQTGVLAQGSGLQVSPTRTELTVDAGGSETFEVVLTNVTSGDVNVTPEVYDFLPSEDGSPRPLAQDKDDAKAVSLKTFIKGITEYKLKPGEKQTAKFTVEIPKNQAAGAYYGLVLFDTSKSLNADTTGEGGKVALSASLGHIVLLQVPGEITEKMQLVSVTAGRKDKDGKVTTGSIFSNSPNQLEITLKNTGNSIIKPFGSVVVRKGEKNIYSYQINNTDVKSNILPNSTRILKDELKDIKGFGRFSILVSVSYGNGGDVLTQEKTVWVIPVWLGAGIGVGVLALAAVVFIAVRKFRR